MAKFWLIQRGTFKENGQALTGPKGVVRLDYMGSAEFEFGAIPKAYRRLMYHFSEYDIFPTEIYTPENGSLVLFCREKYASDVIHGIQDFIKTPYSLKEFSELEKLPTAKSSDISIDYRRSNFWWCIDNNVNGDWMAFLKPHLNLFITVIKNDYASWWLNMPVEERDEEYRQSLSW